MSATLKISQKLDSNHFKVEATEPKVPNRYFKVPSDKADEFCLDYKKGRSRAKLIMNSFLVGGVLFACGLIGVCTKKLSKVAQMAVGIIGGIITAGGVIATSSSIIISKEKKLLAKYKAEEIIHKKKEFSI